MSVSSKRTKRMAILALAASAAVALTTWAQDVLLDNLGFEKSEVSWGLWGDGDIRDEYYSVKAQEGTKFLRLWSRSGWYQDFPAARGDAFTVAAYVNTASKDALRGDAFGEVKVEWRKKTEGDVEVGKATSIKFDLIGKQDTTIAPNMWTKIELPEVKCPPEATHGRVLMTIWCTDEGKGGGCALYDAISITKVAATP